MQIPVSLGGHRTLWSFRDSARFSGWLSTRPWLSGGGLAVLRCGGPGAGQVLEEVLQGAVLAADAGACRPQVREWNIPEDEAGGSFGALGDALGLAQTPSRARELAQRLGPVLSEQQIILVGRLAGDDARKGRLLTELGELLDLLSKQPERPTLTLLLWTDGGQLGGAPSTFDFRIGGPAEMALTALGAPDPVRWATYLHHRLAWESAGSLERTLLTAAAPELATLPAHTGDDAALEMALGLLADRFFATLTDANRQAWTNYAAQPAASYPANCPGLWIPVAGDEPRPEPSLARALLRRGAEKRVRWRLRDSVACRPLATELLMRCLDLEAQLRTDHAHALIPRPAAAGERCNDQHARYADGRLPLMEYPASHPAPPTRQEDVWLFATLGEIVRYLDPGLNRNVSRRYHDLVDLRNAVAHGHHVGWNQWQALRRLSGLGS